MVIAAVHCLIDSYVNVQETQELDNGPQNHAIAVTGHSFSSCRVIAADTARARALMVSQAFVFSYRS